MAIQVEREKGGEQPQVVERPDSFSEKIEKIIPGVQVVPGQFQKQINDDKGFPIIQTSRTKEVTIELPRPERVLEEESKGSPDEARTWLARFWLRLIGKARVFGWQVVGLMKGVKS